MCERIGFSPAWVRTALAWYWANRPVPLAFVAGFQYRTGLMAVPSFDATDFLVGYCAACEKDVLTHVDLGSDGEDVRRCLHCDELVATSLRSVSSEQLTENGYAVIEARTCGNGGGCGAGGCGMRQRVD